MHGTRVRLAVGVCAIIAVTLTGCSTSSKTTAKKTEAPATTTTVAPTPVVVSKNGVKVITGSATGSSPCEKAAPNPASPGEVGAGAGGSDAKATQTDVLASEHGERGMVVQSMRTHADRDALEAQMTTAREVAAKFPTVKDALAGGYAKTTPFVPCIGAHYTNFRLAGSFNPATPSELLYDGTEPDSKIVGLSYLGFHHNGPPPGFSGANDHWHQHNANGGLCLRGGVVIGGEETSKAQCLARGGRKALLIDVWMLHAWIVPGFECSWGTFSGECPELGGRLCGNAWESPDPNDQSQCGKALAGA
jgi:hypothetical protein